MVSDHLHAGCSSARSSGMTKSEYMTASIIVTRHYNSVCICSQKDKMAAAKMIHNEDATIWPNRQVELGPIAQN